MAEDRVVARIGGREVMYSEVWCSREVAAENPKWLRGKTVEEACVEQERERFHAVAARILAEQICAIEGCEPADAEVDAFRSPILKNETMLRGLADLGRKVPEAVARVKRGEPIEAVYEEVIEPMNKSLDQFRREVARYPSLEVLERFLAKDFVASARQQFEDRARDMARRAAVGKRIERLGVAPEEYVRSMIERIGVEILDRQFELPGRLGVESNGFRIP